MTEFERGVDEGLLSALGIITSTPEQTAIGCAKAIRYEMELRHVANAAAPTERGDTPIKWEKVSVRVDKCKRLQALCEQLEPHEHYDGMNECHICDEPLTDVLIRHCESLERYYKAAAAPFAGASKLVPIKLHTAEVLLINAFHDWMAARKESQ